MVFDVNENMLLFHAHSHTNEHTHTHRANIYYFVVENQWRAFVCASRFHALLMMVCWPRYRMSCACVYVCVCVREDMEFSALEPNNNQNDCLINQQNHRLWMVKRWSMKCPHLCILRLFRYLFAFPFKQYELVCVRVLWKTTKSFITIGFDVAHSMRKYAFSWWNCKLRIRLKVKVEPVITLRDRHFFLSIFFISFSSSLLVCRQMEYRKCLKWENNFSSRCFNFHLKFFDLRKKMMYIS